MRPDFVPAGRGPMGSLLRSHEAPPMAAHSRHAAGMPARASRCGVASPHTLAAAWASLQGPGRGAAPARGLLGASSPRRGRQRRLLVAAAEPRGRTCWLLPRASVQGPGRGAAPWQLLGGCWWAAAPGGGGSAARRRRRRSRRVWRAEPALPATCSALLSLVCFHIGRAQAGGIERFGGVMYRGPDLDARLRLRVTGTTCSRPV